MARLPRATPPSGIDARLILNIRWLALGGQLLALLFTFLVLEMDIPIAPALFVIGLSVAMNVWQTRRTMVIQHERDQNFIALIFDVGQLTALLYFTGGLMNPFSVLLLSPVVMSATILRRRETLMLIGLVVGGVTFLSLFNYPLPLGDLASTLIESLGGSILYGNRKAGGGEITINFPRQTLVNT